MSAYLVNEKTLQCAVHAIRSLRSGIFASVTLPPDSTTPAAVELYSRIGQELWKANAAAVAGRYSTAPSELPPFRFDPTLSPTPEQRKGAWENLIYQCAETPVCTTKLFQAMEAVEAELRRELPSVKGTWGILDDVEIPLAPAASAARDAATDVRMLQSVSDGELLKSAERGEAGLIKFYLDDGASPDAADRHGVHALTYAAAGGHADCVALLLAAGASPAVGGGEPLSEAVRVGHATVVAHLLSAGAEPDAKGGHQRGPLALAIAYQRPDCVSLLLDAGASVDDGMRRGARATENGEVVGLVEDAVADRERAERLAGRNNADGAQERFDFGVKP